VWVLRGGGEVEGRGAFSYSGGRAVDDRSVPELSAACGVVRCALVLSAARLPSYLTQPPPPPPTPHFSQCWGWPTTRA
jgi:hypothetical protein